MRVFRVDKRGVRVSVVDGPALPSPEHAPAVRTPEGYLLCDALLARDGLLTYSDGATSWDEYRPRSELDAAAASWKLAPVTDQHPDALVTASTWSGVARGVIASEPEVVELGGVGYLRARLLFCDSELIDTVLGGQVELSIGFTAEVRPTADGVAPDGTACAAVQTALLGNHVASVPEGRAGPACRALVADSAWSIGGIKMDPQQPQIQPQQPAVDMEHEMGSSDMVEIQLPDGSMAMIPAMVAALIEQLKAELAAAQQQPAAEEPAAEPEMSMEAIDKVVRARARIERLAAQAGVPEEMLERPTSDIARAFVQLKIPEIKCDSIDGAALAALVDAAASIPAPAPKGKVEIAPVRTDAKNPADAAVSAYLKRLRLA